MIDKERLMDTMLKLVSVPSISGTEGEASAADVIYSLIEEIPYFKENKDRLQFHAIKNDPLGRGFITALYSSHKDSKKTVIISGHMDVVDIEEYGHLKTYAFNPHKLADHISELKLDEDSEIDLRSGDWIFSRGVADMKYGIALAIEILREFSTEGKLEGNLLFLAVPGEESNSEGMLEAVKYLAELQNKQGYVFTALLMPECYLQKNKNDKARYIHVGTCGKLMPMFYFTGKETHVCEPFSGIDPIMLASEVNRLLSLNVDICDSNKGVSSTPPVCLKQLDMKSLYSVKTPLAAASYYNVITLGTSVSELTDKLKNICVEAFSNVLRDISVKYESYCRRFGKKMDKLEVSPCVITYKELYDRVRKQWGEGFTEYIRKKVAEWEKMEYDNQTKAINIVRETYAWYPDKKPMIILSYIPPYYPDYYPDESCENTKVLLNTINGIIEYAKERFNEHFVLDNYFLGVSDLSYIGLNDGQSLEEVYMNMPGADIIYTLPVEGLRELHIPGVILGAYGKDMHKYTERLNIPFAFEVLPSIYEFAIKSLLA